MSLYSDKTFEALQSEMLANTGDTVDTQEGSLVATAISKQAVRLDELYRELDYVNDNMLVDTQDREHLIASGEECGLPIDEGSAAQLSIVCNCEVETGTEFAALESDYVYVVTDYIGTKEVDITDDDGEATTATWYEYTVESLDDGVEPGLYTGYIEPTEYIEDFDEARIEECTKAGVDEEDTEVYRQRRLAWFQIKPCAGNRAYFAECLDDTGLTTGYKIERRQAGDTSVPIYVQGPDYGVPSADVVSQIQEIIDPTANSGQGYGKAPIGHVVTINAVTGKAINVGFTLTLTDGTEYADIQSQVEAACSAYILELQKSWKDHDYLVVRLSGFENKILDVTSVLDIANVTINGEAKNIQLGTYEIPTLGTVTNS